MDEAMGEAMGEPAGRAVRRVVAINGSPRMEKGDTAMVLDPFLRGLEEAGADVELVYAERLDVRPCTCGRMHCWYGTPGTCCFRDGMQDLLGRIAQADTLVLATPVYIPLPGKMQDVVNRLCPLMEPRLEFREGRTRSRFRDGVALRRMVLVATGGWWEAGNFDTVTRIVEDLSATAGVAFTGAVIRPHAFVMRARGELSKTGRAIQGELQQAGRELAETGALRPETLASIRRPLVSEERLRRMYNEELANANRG